MPSCSCSTTKPMSSRQRFHKNRIASYKRMASKRSAYRPVYRRSYSRRPYSRRGFYKKYAKRTSRISKSIRSMGSCLAKEGPSERCHKKRSSVAKQIDRIQISAAKSVEAGLARWNRKLNNAGQGTHSSFPDLSGVKRTAYASDMDKSDNIAFNT